MLSDLGLKMFEESQVGCTATGVEDTLYIIYTLRFNTFYILDVLWFCRVLPYLVALHV